MNTEDPLQDFHLDILTQQPRINRLYTQITFCFELPDVSSRPEIVQRLRSGIERVSASFPWVAGTVVEEADTFKIREAQKTITFVVKDLTDGFHGWNTLRQADFPFNMLEEKVIAPCKTLMATGQPLPVFLVQASFVTGGLLLTINGQHGSMDMAGQCQVISLLVKACRNEPFTALEVSAGNIDRRHVVQLISSDKCEEEQDRQMVSRNQQEHRPIPPKRPPPNLTWAYFIFSAASLASLKSFAAQTVPPNSFASTDDVLSAFVWQSVTLARIPRLNLSPPPRTTLSRNVDMRHYMSVPATYPGFLTESTVHTFKTDELVHEPLGVTAAQLRSALDREALVRKLRVQATRIDSYNNTPTFAASSNPELDVRLSSWAKERCYEFDFGFGKPRAVRRPSFVDGAREGLVYFLPKTREGDIAVGVCLRDEDLGRLRRDTEFGRFGTYIG